MSNDLDSPCNKNPTACKNCRRRGRKCDRRLPTCLACAQRKTSCEGYNTRWAGVAARGGLAGKDIPTLDTSKPVFREAPKSVRYRNRLRWQDASPISTIKRHRAPNKRILMSQPSVCKINDIELDDSLKSETSSPKSSPLSLENLLLDPEQLNFLTRPIIDIWDSTPNADSDDDRDQNYGEDETDIFDFELDLDLDFSMCLVSPSTAPLADQYLDLFEAPKDIRWLLEYYRCEVAPNFSLDTASTNNPYLSYILPLAYQTSSLSHALAALASCHYYVRSSNTSHQLKYLDHRGKALRLLQERLDEPELVKQPGTLATLLMLTHLDVCYTGISKFEVYFQGAKLLIQRKTTDGSPRGFIGQQFVWLDMMGATSALRDPVFSETDAEHLKGHDSFEERQWSYTDLFACPIDQFDIISRVTTLYKSQPGSSAELSSKLEKAYEYKHKVQHCKTPGDLTGPCFHLAEAFRSAILIYLYRLFPISRKSGEIRALVNSVIAHADAIPSSTGWGFQLLWPLFQAGLEVDDLERQMWLRDRLTHMTSGVAFRNNESALTLLEKVWSGDLDQDYTAIVSGNELGDIMLV